MLYRFCRGRFLAKIAVTSTKAAGPMTRRVLARGEGWTVADVVCGAGPDHRVVEEQHENVSIAIVIGGSFQYESTGGRELMTPGSLLLGNPGQCFECGHEHGVGDRCIAFTYDPSYFARLAEEVGTGPRLARLRVPPVRELSRLVARACAALPAGKKDKRTALDWEEIGLELAARTLEVASTNTPRSKASPAAEARVTRIVRAIESSPERQHELAALAEEAKLSRYHFLRVFQQLTGVTPHKYILRARLRRAATRLVVEPGQVLDIALDCGFGDVSNFNHAFRAEFGVSPRAYRKDPGRGR
jgi:AraC-like DNA-binding protein